MKKLLLGNLSENKACLKYKNKQYNNIIQYNEYFYKKLFKYGTLNNHMSK